MPRVGTVTAQPNANDSFPDGAWGRVDADGTVFVRTTDGERAVGQYPEGSPDEARQSVKKVRDQVTDANAVGDLAALTARLDALGPVLAQQRELRRGERAKKLEESRERKEQIVVEAE